MIVGAWVQAFKAAGMIEALANSPPPEPLFVMHLDTRMLIVGDTPGTHEGQHLRLG
jgi:hypothetical protein